ncbi:hypothetical protein PUN28_011672 [Cardiocondyla obscurior]|uniref:Uncharacterized protein n=1 Tax=Cardiocondyla obscurior TaxID=286306 RepID=A0AAW2FHJ3_9HYME
MHSERIEEDNRSEEAGPRETRNCTEKRRRPARVKVNSDVRPYRSIDLRLSESKLSNSENNP